ncbi:MAG: flagellar basal body rod protein FlgG, partial [Deltaproteobacteria bacterium]
DPEGIGTSLGVIELYTFPNPAGLFSLGRNLYRPTDASGEAISGTPGSDGVGTIAQGFIEMSNVDVVEEMVSMIMAQRAYEINSKAIQTADNMLQIANNIKR